MGAFLIAIVRISLIRAKLAEILEVVHEHVTQIPNFFFSFSQKIYRIYKKRLSLHLPPLLSTPMTQAMKDLGRFTSVNTFGHLGGKWESVCKRRLLLSEVPG